MWFGRPHSAHGTGGVYCLFISNLIANSPKYLDESTISPPHGPGLCHAPEFRVSITSNSYIRKT